MILVNSYEEELFNLFSKVLEYYVRKSQNGEGRTSFNEFDTLKNALHEIYELHFNKILSSYESFIKEKNEHEIKLSFNPYDGSVQVTPGSFWFTSMKDVASVLLNFYKDFINYDEIRKIRRILSIELSLNKLLSSNSYLLPHKEVFGSIDKAKYFIECFIDDRLLTFNTDNININDAYIECFNSVKKNINELKTRDTLRDLVKMARNEGIFRKTFLNKLVRENYRKNEYKKYYDSICNFSLNFLTSLHSFVPREDFYDYGEELLFNRIIGNSVFFEIYVFRKLSDAGIPCMFHLQMEHENQGIREIDLLYWDDKGPGVVEVKAGKIKVEELRVFKEKLRQCNIDKFVVICPESEVHRINREIAKTLTFNDLNDLTNLASLVDFKDF
jgi:hypothetical protein